MTVVRTTDSHFPSNAVFSRNCVLLFVAITITLVALNSEYKLELVRKDALAKRFGDEGLQHHEESFEHNLPMGVLATSAGSAHGDTGVQHNPLNTDEGSAGAPHSGSGTATKTDSSGASSQADAAASTPSAAASPAGVPPSHDGAATGDSTPPDTGATAPRPSPPPVDPCAPWTPLPEGISSLPLQPILTRQPSKAIEFLVPPKCRSRVLLALPLTVAVVDDMSILKDTPYMQQWLPSPVQHRAGLVDGMPPPGHLPPIATDAAFIARLPLAAVEGGSGGVFNQHVFLRNSKWYLNMPSIMFHTAPRVPKLLSMAQTWSDSPQHFMFDTVPRLDFVTPFLRDNPDVKVLMTDGREPRAVVQRIWKDIVHPTRIIWANTELVYPADVVYYAHFYKMPNFPMGAGIGGGLLHIGPALRAPVVTAPAELPVDSPARNKVVYIGRTAGRIRCVANEQAVLAAVRNALAPPFELQVTTDPKALQEIRGLGEAAVLMGPHGGALGNMAFLPPGAGVVEFIRFKPQPDPKGGGPDHIRACYAAMAHAYGLNYHHVEPSDAVFSYDIGCMTVPPAGVVAALRRLGVAKP